jgi:hypothetical protein
MYVHSPILSGVFGSDFSDYYASLKSQESLLMMSATRRRPDLLEDEDQVDRLVYRMWPSQRYHKCLDSLGIDRPSMLESNFETLLPLIRQPTTINEATTRVKLTLLNYSISRAFAILCRTDNQFAQAYILWDKIFKVGEVKYTLEEYHNLLRTSTVKSDITIFPLRHDYDYYLSLCDRVIHFHKTGKRYTLSSQGYASMHSVLPSTREIQQLLQYDWYGLDIISKRAASITRAKIVKMFPWYDSNREASLIRSGLKTPLQLINFMGSYTDKGWGFNFISSGHSKTYRNIVEGLLPLNTIRGYHLSTMEKSSLVPQAMDVRHETRSQLIRAFENRIMDWNFLATCVDKKHLGSLEVRMLDDLIPSIEGHLEELELGSMDQGDDFMRSSLLSLRWRDKCYEAIRSIPYSQILYRVAQSRSQGVWSGHGEILYHTPRGSAIIYYIDRTIQKIKATSLAINYERLLDQVSLIYDSPNIEILSLETLISPPKGLKFYKGDYKTSLQLVDRDNKPILRLDVKPRISSEHLSLDNIADPGIRSWMKREEDPLVWSYDLAGDAYSREILKTVAQHVVQGVKTVDQRVIGKIDESQVKPWLNLFSRGDLDIDDFIDSIMDDLAAPDNGIEEANINNDIDDLLDFLPEGDVSFYYQADVSRLLYHPFVQFFTTNFHRYLPGILGTMRLWLKFEYMKKLADDELSHYALTETLSDRYLLMLNDTAFTSYVKYMLPLIMSTTPRFNSSTQRVGHRRAFE